MNQNIQKPLHWGSRTFVMGIINVTPDSFSGDGLLSNENVLDSAIHQAQKFLEAGADLLDIGGESTRPGSQTVSEQEEIERVIPIVERVARKFPNALISVDTYKSGVARQALQAGAHWLNDVWGFKADPEMAAVAAEFQVPVVLMHNRLAPSSAQVEARLGGRYIGTDYADLIADISNELLESVSIAHQHGIPDERIILDPGIGFGKTVAQNLELIDRLDEIRALGYPLLVGPSRKSFIGYTLDLPPEERLEGTAAAVSLCIDRGADIIRVHDVAAMVRVARMTDAILRRADF
jgi:dihydropteroate synthase